MVAANEPSTPGRAVDSRGQPAIDPTENVKSLTEAAIKSVTDIAELRAEHTREMDKQRQYYEQLLRDADKELRKAESDRIDAIRAVDVQAVQRSVEEAAARANTLATQVSTSADVVRTTLATALEPIQKDVVDLRRSQSEAQGQKTQVVEARSAAEELKPFFDNIQALIVTQAASQGAKAQVVETRGTTNYVTGLIGFGIAAIIGLGTILAMNQNNPTPDPVIITVPVAAPPTGG